MKRLLFLPLLMFTLSGCYLKSVHPLITSTESMELPGLEGTFESNTQRWSFAATNEGMIELLARYENEEVDFDEVEDDSAGFDGYLVLFEDIDADNYEKVLFTAYVGEINGAYFLNLKIFDLSTSSRIANLHQFNVNTFSKINVTNEDLSIEFFKSSWIKEQIQNNRIRIKHEAVNDAIFESTEILITASTRELQQFVEKYGTEEKAFDDAINLPRVMADDR